MSIHHPCDHMDPFFSTPWVWLCKPSCESTCLFCHSVHISPLNSNRIIRYCENCLDEIHTYWIYHISFILHSSYSTEDENHLVLLDFLLVPNDYLFLFWVFSKSFRINFRILLGFYIFSFCQSPGFGGLFHSLKCLQCGWLEWDSHRHKCSQACGYSLGQETPIHAKQLRI